MTRKQRTLRTPVEFSGVGLHSGETIKARLLPAAQGEGIEFVRTDLTDAPSVPAHIAYHSPMDRRTRLSREGAHVETVEHFLAACSAYQIDNLRVELSGTEFPGLDGSALPFVEFFRQAGTVEQREEAKVFRLDQPVYVRDGDATLVALPTESPDLVLQYVAFFDEPGVESGAFQTELTAETFEQDIAPARTFCLASEVEFLIQHGFGKGANKENTVVLGDPETEFRMPDEPVRHKMLDLIGDLRLLGADLSAHIIANPLGPQDERGARTPPARPDAGPGDRRPDPARVRARHPRDRADAASPLPVPLDRPRDRGRGLPARGRDQERDDQRALLPGPLPRDAAHAGGPAARGDGPARGDAPSAQARTHRKARRPVVDRQGQAPGGP